MSSGWQKKRRHGAFWFCKSLLFSFGRCPSASVCCWYWVCLPWAAWHAAAECRRPLCSCHTLCGGHRACTGTWRETARGSWVTSAWVSHIRQQTIRYLHPQTADGLKALTGETVKSEMHFDTIRRNLFNWQMEKDKNDRGSRLWEAKTGLSTTAACWKMFFCVNMI